MTELYRVLYCSRNPLPAETEDTAEQIRIILDVSRRNNARDSITGGLLFSAGHFAQVLEGPPAAVEAAFERIQCDERHNEVTVLEAGPIEKREFVGWSMAFSKAAASHPLTATTLEAACEGESGSAEGLLAIMRSIVDQDEPAPPRITESRAYHPAE